MRAAVMGEGGTFVIETVPDPSPGPGEVVVRVAASGVCGSDLKARPFMPAGTIMGHELAGEVVAVGTGANVPLGTPVAALPAAGCGTCAWCNGGNVAHCADVKYVGMNLPGGFAEHVVVPAAHAFPLGAGTSGELGALVEPFAVGLHGAVSAGVGPGDHVLVVGAGTVGLTMVAWSRQLGAERITAVDPSAGRRDLAVALGATDVLAALTDAAPASYDVVAECVGKGTLLNGCALATKPLGRVVILGVAAEPDTFFRVSAVLNELTFRFSVGYVPGEFTAVTDAFATGVIDPTPMLGERFSLDDTAAAFDHAATTPDGKVLVCP